MDYRDDWQVFQEAAALHFAIAFDEGRLQQFQMLYKLLIEANRITNLTRITALDDFCTRHLLDSLTLSRILNRLPPDFNLMDLGSGAGFPALPLAIAYPEARITALESVQKKARFIEQAIDALELANIRVLAGRAETLSHDRRYREQFDIVTARAVSSLNTLVELCLPFARIEGQLLAMKTLASLDAEQQAARNAMELLGGEFERVEDVSLPLLPNRGIAVILKTRTTPARYPRNSGIPAKKPL